MNRHMTKTGYQIIQLFKNGKGKYYSVHRLVAEAFIPNSDNLPQVNHRNEITTDNSVWNLEWCDQRYNNTYGTRIKRQIEKQSKTVLQLTYPEGEFIKEWESIMEAGRNGFNQSSVSLCCNGKLKKHHGYMFKFKKEEN